VAWYVLIDPIDSCLFVDVEECIADVWLQYLMVDIVVNHNGWNGPPDSVDYSKFNPFNKKEYYNTPYCEIDYNDLGDTVSNRL
jgi:hypothetical protein